MTLLRAALVLLLAALPACDAGEPRPAAPSRSADAAADHLLIVSVDGLRPDALADCSRLPAFARLLAGAATLDARCDPDWTVTLPNHVGMLTGRFTDGSAGHGWTLNSVPPPPLQLRADQRSALHVAADAGVRTAMFAGKEKFLVFPRSWNGIHTGWAGGVIHHYAYSADAGENARALCTFWESGDGPSIAFWHLAEPDVAGHAEGWDLQAGSRYLEAVARADAALGAALSWLDARPARRARTAIVLTADHGGGAPFKNHHGEGRALLNARVPFVVWSGGGAARGDLYQLNPDARRAPGETDPERTAVGPPPIRNLDAAATALSLLGLPQLPADGGSGAAPLRLRAGEAP